MTLMAHSCPHRHRIGLVTLLFLLLVLVAACGINQELLGTWQLIDADGTAFEPPMQIIFRKDRQLVITPAPADATISYTSSPGGNLSMTVRRAGANAFTLKMSYDLDGDWLAITDEDGITLVFLRQTDPIP
ncbi:MAG TPA: hypothetical protein PK646_02860 [Bacillota bacterium]|nr:hypothetical protein [Fastidiosipila sp.]HPX92645.1 hypothetical protein [Bacillota bacterium]HQB81012.1 hypothetical protein [Bacillota bacterium]